MLISPSHTKKYEDFLIILINKYFDISHPIVFQMFKFKFSFFGHFYFRKRVSLTLGNPATSN